MGFEECYLAEDFVHRLENEFDECTLIGCGEWFLAELPGLLVKVEVTPQSTGQLLPVEAI